MITMVLLAERVPPDALTRTRMNVAEQRIREYASTHRRLPASLSDLPKSPRNRDSNTLDGWRRPIQYTRTGMTVTLLSLGRHGRLGGMGQDADTQVTFVVAEAPSRPTIQK